MPDYGTRDFYRHLAHQGDEPEALPMADPLDLPDWDWPDAPEPADPRVNDRALMTVVVWMVACATVIVASLAYLACTVKW